MTTSAFSLVKKALIKIAAVSKTTGSDAEDQGSDQLQTAPNKTIGFPSLPNPKQEYRSSSTTFWFCNPQKPQKIDEPLQKKIQPQKGRYSLPADDIDAANDRLHRREFQRRNSYRYPHDNGSPKNNYAWGEDFERRDRYVPRQCRGRRDGSTLVRDNEVIGYDPSEVAIGERNWGGRRTGGRVTGNVVVR